MSLAKVLRAIVWYERRELQSKEALLADPLHQISWKIVSQRLRIMARAQANSARLNRQPYFLDVRWFWMDFGWILDECPVQS